MHMTQVIPRLMDAPVFDRFRSKSRNRAYTRHPCCAVATLLLIDKGVELEGLTLELSRGGALFREACSFILQRNGAPVTLRLPDAALPGSVVNTRTEGYGVRFEKVMDADMLEDLLRRYAPLS
jgi:hypothetical protein